MKIERAYSTIDVHVAGEAFRIIQTPPFVHYQSLEQLYEQFPQVFKEEQNLLLNEPRGFAGLNGALAVPPINRDADIAVLFFNHAGTVPVHYSGIIAVITALLESGQLKIKDSGSYNVETVRGVISVTAIMEKGEVIAVKLESGLTQLIDSGVPLVDSNLNTKYSLVQSDQLYAVFQKQDFPFHIQVEELAELKKWGQTVLQALGSKTLVSGVVLVDDSALDEERIKTITFRDDGYIVRSPGFGSTVASYISLVSNERIAIDGFLRNESIFGSELAVRVSSQKESGYHFMLTGRGFVTGMQTFLLDPTDPLATGFLLK
jgi:proline racemase